VYVLDFGAIPEDEQVKRRFGITIIPGALSDPEQINMKHAIRLTHILSTLNGEGIPVDTLQMPLTETETWIDVTLKAIEKVEASHVVAVDNVFIPLDTLRNSIKQIERKGSVEYILVDPTAGM
jgi:hypothetical protein